MDSLGHAPELVILLLLALLFFGSKNLGSVGKGLGEGIASFRKALKGDDAEGTGESGRPATPSAGALTDGTLKPSSPHNEEDHLPPEKP